MTKIVSLERRSLTRVNYIFTKSGVLIYLFIYILGVLVSRQSLNTSGVSTDGLKDRFDCINKTFQVTFRSLDYKLQGFSH